MIILDTSVWIGYFREGQPAIDVLLRDERILGHPWVVDELALGTLPDRDETLARLRALPMAKLASSSDLRQLLDSGKVHGRGIGLVDLAVAASTLLTPDASLWTLDRRLQAVVTDLVAR